jgi:predicted PurR-regulated permease PerM
MSSPKVEHRRRRPVRFAVWGIFTLLIFYTLYFAASLILPIYLAALLSLVLSPLVRGLERAWVPPPLGAAIVLIVVFAGVGYAFSLLMPPATEWMSRGPGAVAQIEQRLRVVKQPLEQMTKATQKVEQLTEVEGSQTPTVELRQMSLAETLFSGTRTLLMQGGLVVVLLYFLLSADGFLNRVVTILPLPQSDTKGKQLLRHVESEISRYLLTISLINAGLAAVVTVVMHAFGLPSPLLWGVMGGILNFIPFVGAMASAAVIGIVSLLTFDDLGRALLPPLAFIALTSLEGFFVTPTLIGRRMTFGPIPILLAVFVGSWLWGVAGALIAVPTLAIGKIVYEHIAPISTLITTGDV